MKGKPRKSPPLAEAISAVLEHPDTPADIHNNLVDGINEYFWKRGVDILKPEVLAVALPLALKKKEKGCAR